MQLNHENQEAKNLISSQQMINELREEYTKKIEDLRI